MKLYQVSAHALGGQLAATGGSQVYAFTAKAEALRKYKSEIARLQKLDVEFNVTLYEVETPNHVGATAWMEYIECGYLSGITLTPIERENHRKAA